MRRPSPIPSLLAMVAAMLATLPAHAHTPGATVRTSCGALRLAAEADDAGARLCRLIETGELPDLRWPDFTNYREQVRQFYGPAFSPAWTSNSAPTPQARALVQALQRAEERGLEPEDYDASRWTDRLARFASANPVSSEELARFDLALTISALRYVSHVHHGRLNPADFQSGLKRLPFDAAGFLKREVVAAANVPAALASAEPASAEYRRALKALQDYLLIARGGEGDPIPRTKEDLYPDNTYSGVMQLAAKLRRTGDLSADAKIARPGMYEEPLVSAMKHFEGRNGIEPDGILGPDTYSHLDVPLAQRATQLKLALERWRWLPEDAGPRFITVNLPEFRLRAFEGGRQTLTMKVVIGEASGVHTPSFADRVDSIVFRPYWRIPPHVAKYEILPDVRKDPHYLWKNHMEVVNASGQIVAVDQPVPAVLQQLDSGKLSLRQQPGDGNAMGLVKFVFPSREGLYLHGTSEANLFASSRRDFSHGCIRLEHPLALASWVLRNSPEWTPERVEAAMVGNQSIPVKLGSPVPVFVTYNTAVVEENGDVHFFDDIYGQDAALEKALAAARP
jgi:murein L,D-transpeptidase YcbB/YkuD